jgi:hypothetical protein
LFVIRIIMWSLVIVSKFIAVCHVKFQTLLRLNKNVTPQRYRPQLHVVATVSASAGEPVALAEALHHLFRSANWFVDSLLYQKLRYSGAMP